MKLELWLAKKSDEFPIELTAIAKMKATGVTISLVDYNSMSSIIRDDIILWNNAFANVKAEAEMN